MPFSSTIEVPLAYVAPVGAGLGRLWSDLGVSPVGLKQLTSLAPDVWTVVGSGGPSPAPSHASLSGVSGDQHHPQLHAAQHAAAAGDALTLAQAQVTNLVADLAAKVGVAGEIGGTAAFPTVVAAHSGSTHAAIQAAAEATASAALAASSGAGELYRVITATSLIRTQNAIAQTALIGGI